MISTVINEILNGVNVSPEEKKDGCKTFIRRNAGIPMEYAFNAFEIAVISRELKLPLPNKTSVIISDNKKIPMKEGIENIETNFIACIVSLLIYLISLFASALEKLGNKTVLRDIAIIPSGSWAILSE